MITRLRAPFWVYLTLISLVTLTVTFIAITFSWRNNVWRIIDDFNGQIGEQVVTILNEKLNNLLEVAPHQAKINQELIGERFRVFTPGDFTRLSEYWVDVMRIHTNLSYLSISFEEDGRMLMVSRNPKKELRIADLRRSPTSGKLELREYLPGEYPDNPYRLDPDREFGDPRNRPWYKDAKAAGSPLWSDVYVFIGSGDSPNVPGVTYATPFYGEEGRFIGVMTADIDLLSLCEYLQENRRVSLERVSRGGLASSFAFIAHRERKEEGHVIAYHDVSKIMRQSPDDPSTWELIPGHELTETCLRGFYENVIAGDTPLPQSEPVGIRYLHSDITYAGVIQKLRGTDMPDWVIGVAIEEKEFMGPIVATLKQTFLWGFLCLLAAVMVSVFLARRISQPLQWLALEAQEIGKGNLTQAETRTVRIREIDSLFRAKEEMKKGLRSFEKYVPKELVRELLTSGQEAELGGKRASLSVAFADIVNFTSMAEFMAPEEVVEMLSLFHGTMYDSIMRNSGTLDKYIGDAVMAFWGAPFENPDHAYFACRAALDAQESLATSRLELPKKGSSSIHCRIGINTGEVVVGNMGNSHRLSYTVIGDAVNLASRLEGLNRFYGTEILISEETYLKVSDRLVARKLDRVFVKGKSQGVFLYELVGAIGQVDQKTLRDLGHYEEALELYFRRSWSESIRILEKLQKDRPSDPSILQLLSRCRQFMEEAPDPDWDGSYRVG